MSSSDVAEPITAREPSPPAKLFVGNLSSVANAQYLERLFSAYGEVQKVEMLGETHQHYAEVTYSNVDDADVAIATLHYRYETSRGLPLIVLYSKNSPCHTTYGLKVSHEFSEAVHANRMPQWIPLDAFEAKYARNTVQPPPSERELITDNRQGGGLYY